MNRQAAAFALSLGIHGLAALVLLLAGTVPHRTKAIVLDFSLSNSAVSEQARAAAAPRPAPQKRRMKTVTPVVKDEQAMPVKQEQKPEEIPAPVSGETPAAEEPAAGTETAAPSSEDSGARYAEANFIYIRDRIFRNLSYPPLARKMGWSGKVVVSFTVCVDGSIEDLAVAESSGYSLLDRSALEAVRKSCPLPRPPEKAALIMPVLYRLE